MRLARYGAPGAERPAIIDAEGTPRDLTGIVDDVAGEVLTRSGLDWLRAVDPSTLPAIAPDTRVGASIGRIGKFICIGLNFRDHAAESDMALPEQPVLFMKATSAVCGPDDDTVIPRGSEKTDWEVELGVVIGDVARDVPIQRAMEYVAGYVLINDLSERAFQLEHGGQWVKGKSCDTFGPWLLTADEVADPQALGMWLKVNGHRYQNGSSADMVFGVAHLVSYVSRYMSLHPGDIISTGTPAGVGLGQKPPAFLKVGDIVRLGIDGLGTQRQTAVAA